MRNDVSVLKLHNDIADCRSGWQAGGECPLCLSAPRHAPPAPALSGSVTMDSRLAPVWVQYSGYWLFIGAKATLELEGPGQTVSLSQ